MTELQIQNPFLTAQSTQIKSVISVPIKDFIHHYPRALFNDIPRVGAHFYDGASTKASPFHPLIVLGKNDCPYWLVVWQICLNFMVFSSSTLIRLDKDAFNFKGHLCQTINNFVKQNESSVLSLLRKRRPQPKESK